jgi:inward rectifier potassium channel
VSGRARHRRRQVAGQAVVTHGLRRRAWQDLYHYCMTVSWPWFFASWAGVFVAFNLVFATIYGLVPDAIANLDPPGFAGDLFFSIETLATVGYGHMHPASIYGHVVAAAEIFLGLTSLALVTGVIFARFSRPTARFLFAEVAVVRPLDGRRVIMLRVANARQNLVLEASARLRLIRNVVSTEGYRMRRVFDLRLVREEQPVFVLGWNLMHVIDESSPLAGETAESLGQSRASLNLTLSGRDETTGQVLMARHGYAADAIRWNHSFRDVIADGADGAVHFDYTNFHTVEPYPVEDGK